MDAGYAGVHLLAYDHRTDGHALDHEKACIIGAGIAGLTAAKALQDRGIPYDQFELERNLGGLWRIDHERSSAYRTLHIISSKYNMELADFPMPDDFPEYGHHSDIRQIQKTTQTRLACVSTSPSIPKWSASSPLMRVDGGSSWTPAKRGRTARC
ncbi:MAG: NAD(P)-binding protein [Gammaproteobacteria bacterium]|nr:NAD(P)-binding protein [Gammaproteobacteria bacterium]